VFPVRYELKIYILFRRNSVFKVLNKQVQTEDCFIFWQTLCYLSGHLNSSEFNPGHMARMGRRGMHRGFWWEIRKERDHEE
jgi:hypothetical protein